MKIENYRKQYLTSLFGSVYEESLDRTFPIVRSPQRYTDWCDQNPVPTTQREIDVSRLWLASDHHFDHANIMKYTNRKFDSVPAMNQYMIDQHNQVVKPDDTVIFGGDIAFCATNKANEFLSKMNGYKILIVGNHDWERKTGKLRNFDVDEVHMSYFVETNKVDVLITHVPFHSTTMLENEMLVNVHGHIHDKKIAHPRYINICVEHHDYQPQLLTDLLAE